jgi:Flp pilus assembly pilin Flp
MRRFLPRSLVRFLKNDEGVTAVECALMLALVVVICLVALTPTSPPADAAIEPTVSVEVEHG